MTGKLLDRGSPGALVFILPIALAVVLLLNFWPIILLVIFLGILWKIWENYQWNQWCKQVNPFFYGLIKENQGCLTPIDLSLKANLTASAAQRFLEKKAEEFGAQRQIYEDKGTVYYFLTASALGQIFEDSEPEEKLSPKQTPQLTNASSEVESDYQASSASDIAQLVELENDPSTSEQPEIENTSSPTPFKQTEETISSDSSEKNEAKSSEETTSSPTEVEVKEQLESDLNSDVADLDSQKHSQTTSYTVSSESASEVSEPTKSADESNSEQPEATISPNSQIDTEAKPESDSPELNSENDNPVTEESSTEEETSATGEHPENSEKKNNTHSPLIQAELAKRLDLHSSTIAKRRSDPDFTEWSQSKDPEGIGWKYLRRRRVFIPVES